MSKTKTGGEYDSDYKTYDVMSVTCNCNSGGSMFSNCRITRKITYDHVEFDRLKEDEWTR